MCLSSPIGVAAWWWAWVVSTGEAPLSGGASGGGGGATEGEVRFAEPQPFTPPQVMPAEADGAARFALVLWSSEGGPAHACAYTQVGEQHQRLGCDVDPATAAQADWVAVTSEVAGAAQPGPGRVFIDFSGSGVFVVCDGRAAWLGAVPVESVDFGAICTGS